MGRPAAAAGPGGVAVREILAKAKAVVGVVHVGALPGTPRGGEPVGGIAARARAEALVYRDAGIDALAIENMHDVPYLRGAVGPEIVAAMSVIGLEVKRATDLPCGIQILAGANREALAAARAAGLDFVRVEGFVFAHVADEGVHDACAGPLLRYRRQIGAEAVLVFADVKKKHASHALTADVDVAETARAAELFLADGVVVTGPRTGAPASLDDLRAVKAAVSIPVVVGSGVDAENVEPYLEVADALIVGSSLKEGGDWSRAVDGARVRELMRIVERSR
jgi:uncharacterized protein